ncbi:MAG: hypothetical protein M1820_010480 [Bogoriella megaspora]|nr:MAG: hypothetical protein M1820_010480 [Bogoriella megaspora]
MGSPYSGPSLPTTSPAQLPTLAPLHGTHVTLERLSQGHVADLYSAIGSTEDLWLGVPSGPFPTLSSFSAYIERRINIPKYFGYAIILHRTGKPVGLVALDEADANHRSIEIGPVVYGRELQRSRAGTEVMYLLGKLVFGEMGFRRLEWRCNSLNEASKRAAERYGFMYEGCLRKHMIVRGRNRDTLIYSLVDEDWPAQRRVFEIWLAEGNFDEEGRQRRTLNEIREAIANHQPAENGWTTSCIFRRG